MISRAMFGMALVLSLATIAGSGAHADPAAETTAPEPKGVACRARDDNLKLYKTPTESQPTVMKASKVSFPLFVFRASGFRIQVQIGETKYWVAAKQFEWRWFPEGVGSPSRTGDAPDVRGTRGLYDAAARTACARR